MICLKGLRVYPIAAAISRWFAYVSNELVDIRGCGRNLGLNIRSIQDSFDDLMDSNN